MCRDIREAGLITPILMLTARGQTSDKVNGLKIGADDYVTKPFNMLELMARVEALLRRAPIRPAAQTDGIDFGSIHVDLVGTEATRDGKPVNLSAREFQLLRYFIEHRGATLSRDELAETGVGLQRGHVHAHRGRARRQPAPKAGRRSQAAEIHSDGAGARL